MSERFNFYDVYGYLIPGLVLVLLLWLPYGVVNYTLPDEKITAAAVAIAVAYVLGHFVQGMAAELVSGMTATDANGAAQYPTVVLLNRQTMMTPNQLKVPKQLADAIQKNVFDWFSLDLKVGTDASRDSELRDARAAAFYLCRPIVNKATGYPEQFHGLTAMMSGLSLSFVLAWFYLVGWTMAAAPSLNAGVGAGLLVWLSLAAMLVVAWMRLRRGTVWENQSRFMAVATISPCGLFLLGAGYLLGARAGSLTELGATFAVAAALCVVAALRCFYAYRYFSNEFAKALWYYFPAKPEPTPSGSRGDGSDSQR